MLSPAVADPHCLPRALYTYEDGSDDLKLAASGGKLLCPHSSALPAFFLAPILVLDGHRLMVLCQAEVCWSSLATLRSRR